MAPRSLLCAAALAALGCAIVRGGGPTPDAAPEPASVGYRPFLARYEVATHGRVEQELENQQVVSDEFAMRYYLSVRVAPADTAFQVTLTLDSVGELTGGALGLPAGEAERARGAAFTARLAPTGELREFRGGDTAALFVQQLASRLRQFFPRLPAGGARPGQRWRDTSHTYTTSGGLDLTIRSVNQHEASAWSTWAGSRVLPIATVSQYTVAGSGIQGGQQIVLEGAGRRHTQHYLDRQGRYLGMTAADTSRLVAYVEALDVRVPITQTRVDTLLIRS